MENKLQTTSEIDLDFKKQDSKADQCSLYFSTKATSIVDSITSFQENQPNNSSESIQNSIEHDENELGILKI
jgi:hypothetical protein